MDPGFHEYQRDPHSGAGNCICGAPAQWQRHPHQFEPSRTRHDLCTCTLPREAGVHVIGAIWR